MKIAVIGSGHTGQAVIDCLHPDSIQGIYNSDNPVSLEKLKTADVAIIFVTENVLMSIMPTLLESKIPVVCGTTGISWDREAVARIQTAECRWLVANNFSLAMALIQQCLTVLGQGNNLFDQVKFSIHEIHHANKLDAPSGTAHSWYDWLNVPSCEMSYERVGDIAGIHELQIDTPYESITLKHVAHDRRLFAQGALWAAQYLVQHPELAAGVHLFSDVINATLLNEQSI